VVEEAHSTGLILDRGALVVLAGVAKVVIHPLQISPVFRALQILAVEEAVEQIRHHHLAAPAAQASSSSNTLVVPQQALQSSQDRPHGLPRLA
jgi:hypothetical protein